MSIFLNTIRHSRILLMGAPMLVRNRLVWQDRVIRSHGVQINTAKKGCLQSAAQGAPVLAAPCRVA
jgi:hypothetical protein